MPAGSVRIGKQVENIEVSDVLYERVCKLLSDKPLFEVLDNFQKALAADIAEARKKEKEMVTAHQKTILEKQEKVEQLKADLADEEAAQVAEGRAGKYTRAIQHEARKAELNQAVLEAQVEFAELLVKVATEQRHFFEEKINRSHGTHADSFKHTDIYDVTRLVLSNWFIHMGQDIPSIYGEASYYAGAQLQEVKGLLKAAKEDLLNFQMAAQTQFTGGAIREKTDSQVR
jgi:hypothetical protein